MWTDLFELVQKKGSCKKHGAYTTQVLKLYESARVVCPICVRELSDSAEEQEAIEQKHKQWVASNVEVAYWGKTVADFKTVKGTEIAREKIAELIATGKGEIVLLGSNGVGKSMLGNIAVMELGGYIYTMYEISVMIRQSYGQHAKETELEIMDRLSTAPLLVIDELARTKNSEAEQNWLSYIIDKRHIRGLPFILISNSSEIEKILGNDILSRLQERASIIEIDAEDYRGKVGVVCQN